MIESETLPKDINPESPWLGLRSFTEGAHEYFFGRKAELEDLYERVLDKPLTVLFGQSGLGKSSLVRAGLSPMLRKAGLLPIFIRFDHDPESKSIEDQLLESLMEALDANGWKSLGDSIRSSILNLGPVLDAGSLLWLVFHDPAIGLIPKRGTTDGRFPRPVFIVDQFEEIFTLGDRKERRPKSDAFRESLAGLAENRHPLGLRKMLETNDELTERIDFRAQPSKILIVMREDFLHLLERWRRTVPSIMTNRVELRMLNGPQALLAVFRPGQIRNPDLPIITEDLGKAIVRFVAGQSDETPLSQIDAVPPLLSLVCSELNAQRIANQELQITRSQFEGRSADVLAGFYARSYDLELHSHELTGRPDAKRAMARIRELIEDRLLSPDGYRESISYDTIVKELTQDSSGSSISTSTAKSVLEALVNRRLLTVEERGGVGRIELTHDILSGIVRASRDQRHEIEAQDRLRESNERAEREKARILSERNKLRNLAILACCLALISLGTTIVALTWFQRARSIAAEARQSELEARTARDEAIASEELRRIAEEKAIDQFRLTRGVLEDLHEKVVNKSVGEVPGIGLEKAVAIKREVRELITRLLKRGATEGPQDPKSIKTIRTQLVRILLEEGRDEILVKRFTAASRALQSAYEYSLSEAIESAEDAELRADILLERCRVFSVSGEDKEGSALALDFIPLVKELGSLWPESWRIDYILIRLENLVNVGSTQDADVYARLLGRMEPLVARSNQAFDPTLWTFTLGANQNSEKTSPLSSLEDYQLSLDLIMRFRQRLMEPSAFTILQKEEATNHFMTFLGELEKRLNGANDPATLEARREILKELENTVGIIEKKILRSSLAAFKVRESLFRIQLAGVGQGIIDEETSKIDKDAQKHRNMAAQMGVGTSFSDLFHSVLQRYTSSSGDAKSEIANEAKEMVADFALMDLGNAESVVSDNRIGLIIEGLSSNDPLAVVYRQFTDQFLDKYKEKRAEIEPGEYFQAIIEIAKNRLPVLRQEEKFQDIADFWEIYFKHQPVLIWSHRDQSTLVDQLRTMATAMSKLDKNDVAERIWRDTYALCVTIVKDRPWDFYVRQSHFGLCFEAARDLSQEGTTAQVQDWLNKGWNAYKDFSGDDIDLESIPILPLRGEVPSDASDQERKFFEALKPVADGGTPNSILIVPCDFDGVIFPLRVYVVPAKTSYQRVLDQLKWVQEYRGGKPDSVYVQLIESLGLEATNKDIDFKSLYDSAFQKRLIETKNRELLETLSLESKRRIFSASNDWIEILPETRKVFESLIQNSIGSNNWSQVEYYARRWLARDSENPDAQAALAISLVAQGRYADGNDIYKFNWPSNKNAIAETFKAFNGNDERADSFKRLLRIADENNVSFPDLNSYALSSELEEQRTSKFRRAIAEKSQRELTKPNRDVDNLLEGQSSDRSKAAQTEFVAAMLKASDQAMFALDWDQAEEFTQSILKVSPDSIKGKARLATILLFKGNQSKAEEILLEIWDRFEEQISGGEYVLCDHTALASAGHLPEDRSYLESKFGADPDAAMNSLRLILTSENDGDYWTIFQSFRGYDDELETLALQVSDPSAPWDWKALESFGSILEQSKTDPVPTAKDVFQRFQAKERKPHISDALCIGTSKLSEYRSARWDLESLELRLLHSKDPLPTSEGESLDLSEDSNKQALVQSLKRASRTAMFVQRWAEVEQWSRRALEIAPEDSMSYGYLANAMLYTRGYQKALDLYRAHWNDKVSDGLLEDGLFSEWIQEEFKELEQAGVSHPDIKRLLGELMEPKPD